MLPNPNLEVIFERIGNKLSQIRHSRREIITSAAKNVGISHSVLSQVENGRYYSLSFDLLSRIAGYYHVTIDELLLPIQPDSQPKDSQQTLVEFLLEEIKELKSKAR